MYKLADLRKVYQEVRIIYILYRNPKLSDSGSRIVSGYGFAPYGHYMSDPAF